LVFPLELLTRIIIYSLDSGSSIKAATHRKANERLFGASALLRSESLTPQPSILGELGKGWGAFVKAINQDFTGIVTEEGSAFTALFRSVEYSPF
jgi:hypothetical protein